MSETYETVLAIVCAHCPYKTTWKFQLDHHIQRWHKNIHAAKLFHAIVEPEQNHCLCCGFKSYHKLGKALHSLSHNDFRSNEDGQYHLDEKYKRYDCDNCKHKGYSCLSFCKHNDMCKIIPNVLAADIFPSATSKIDRKYCPEPQDLKFTDPVNHFQCSQCPYRSKNHLRRHVRLKHAGAQEINWFNCSKCSYRGKSEEYLKSHMLIHASADEVNWYNCAECSYRCKRKNDLKNHMLSHALADEINWYNYAKCSYRSKRKGDLKSHMMSHASADEINWYNYAKCSYRSKRKQDLERHTKRDHV